MDLFYAQVIVPLKLGWTPCYSFSGELKRGDWVSVEFSGRKYPAVVYSLEAPANLDKRNVKPLTRVRSELPGISEMEFILWEFIASYYLCSLGEVFRAAYPSSRIRSGASAAARLEKMKQRLGRLEESLGKKHGERVRLRLEEEAAEIRNAVEEASNLFPAPVYARPNPPKPRLTSHGESLGIYREAIQNCLNEGGQALVLAPEISFCKRLKESLGAEARIVNSDQPDGAVQQVCELLRRGEKLLVIGTRSAIFLPFTKLRTVIIDEEQDQSFKQSEPAPRYNARDCAIYLASLFGAEVILGSSLPSFESIQNCISGKYTCNSLEKALHPERLAEIVDISAERKKNGMSGSFSRKLLDRIAHTPGRICLIRGWEKPEELEKEISLLLPGREFDILTFAQLKRQGCRGAAISAVMQIDALYDKDDFRADERALQTLALLQSLCCGDGGTLVVQTAVSERFSPDRDYSALLRERRDFSFPPFTRLVEIRRYGSGELVSRHFLQKDSGLAARKAELARTLPPGCYADVDP